MNKLGTIGITAHSRKKLARQTLDYLEGIGIDDLDIIHELHIAALNKLGKTDREKAIRQFIKMAGVE